MLIVAALPVAGRCPSAEAFVGSTWCSNKTRRSPFGAGPPPPVPRLTSKLRGASRRKRVRTTAVNGGEGENTGCTDVGQGLRTEHITFSNRGEKHSAVAGHPHRRGVAACWPIQHGGELCPVEPKGAANWYGEQFWGEESKYSDRPGLRLLNIIETAAMTPQKDCKALFPPTWPAPKTPTAYVESLSGMAAFVRSPRRPISVRLPIISALTLQAKLKVPVGLVTASGRRHAHRNLMSLDALLTIPGYEKATTALNRDGPAGFFNA